MLNSLNRRVLYCTPWSSLNRQLTPLTQPWAAGLNAGAKNNRLETGDSAPNVRTHETTDPPWSPVDSVAIVTAIHVLVCVCMCVCVCVSVGEWEREREREREREGGRHLNWVW